MLVLEKKIVKKKLIDISSQIKVKKLLENNHNNLINYYCELTVPKKKVLPSLGFYTRAQGNYIQSLINIKKSNLATDFSTDLRGLLKLNYPLRATSVILDEFVTWTPGTILCFYQNYLIRYHEFNAFRLNYKDLMLRFILVLDA